MGFSAMAAVALATTAYSMDQQRSAANKANDQQQAALQYQKDQAAQAEASKPQADVAPNTAGAQSAMAGTGQAGGSPGVAQTFLTGASGVDPSTLDLGKKTLLGG